jgi:hypothetical protein
MYEICYTSIFSLLSHLLRAQNFWSSLLNGLLLLVTSIKRICGSVVSGHVVEILDLVDTDDPVLAGEGFLNGVESWALVRQLNAADTVLALSGREEGAVVVVGHLVPVIVLVGKDE